MELDIGTVGADRICDRTFYRNVFFRHMAGLWTDLRPELAGSAGSGVHHPDAGPADQHQYSQRDRRDHRTGGVPFYQIDFT